MRVLHGADGGRGFLSANIVGDPGREYKVYRRLGRAARRGECRDIRDPFTPVRAYNFTLYICDHARGRSSRPRRRGVGS